MITETAIAFGGDSSVYRTSDYVKKVYDGGPLSSPLKYIQVEFYANVSNQAASYGSTNPIEITYGNRNYPVIINPVTRISNENGIAVIHAPFVDGYPLSKGSNIPEIRAALLRLSRHLNESLGTEGIEITPGNAMLCNDQIVITDLCASVRRLKKIRSEAGV